MPACIVSTGRLPCKYCTNMRPLTTPRVAFSTCACTACSGKALTSQRPGRIISGAWCLAFSIRQDELDGRIGQVAQRYPVDTLLVIDRNILRMALYEIEAKDFPSPVRVVIAEAIQLAEAYGSEVSPNFVHGVLGALLAQQEPAPVTV